MQFNDTVTKTGILQDIEQRLFGDDGFGAITGDSNRKFIFTNNTNRALDRYGALSLRASGRWQVDDYAHGDLNIAKTGIVSGQYKYVLSGVHVEIERIELKQEDGSYIKLDSTDINYDENVASNLSSGTPTKADKRGRVIYLNAIPDFNRTEGLRIFYKRPFKYFLHDDTVAQAGLPPHHQAYLPLYASMVYAVDKQMPNGKNLYERVKEFEAEIMAHYSSRQRDDKPKLKITNHSNK